MAKKTVSRSVVFYKRMIAAVLAVVILALAGLSGYLALGLRRARAELDEAQGKLFDIEVREMEKRAEEEAERLRSAIPPEQSKPEGERGAAEILAEHTLVAHALGAAEGVAGLNCLEGFLENYDAGVRVFEADLRMTADGFVVLRHDWSEGLQEGVGPTAIPTLDEFLSKPILGKYTPLSFRNLLLLMAQYSDICIVTDTKLTDAEAVTAQFRSMLDEAHRLGLSYLFERMAVQVYSPDHFAVVDGLHHFPCYIYTLYQDSFAQTEDAFRSKCIFCQEHDIFGLALWEDWWDADYAPISDWREIRVFVHTVNDARAAQRLLRSGVGAVYTDALKPADMEG